jgi:hypothetical protein
MTQWGVFDDIPVPGDYDADGRTDIAIWRPSAIQGVFWILKSSNGGLANYQFGLDQDAPAANFAVH